MAAVTAPVTEIGYVTQSYSSTTSNWWMYDGETTPELMWPQSVEVYDAMRKQDAQVGSVLEAVTRPVLRTPWRIDPAGARTKVVELVADDLGLPIVGQNPQPPPRTKDRFSWLEHLELALLMLPFGHMFFEQVYRIDEAGRRAHLRKLAPRMPRTIEQIDVARDGGLVSITQLGRLDQRGPQKPIPVDHLVAYVYKREGGNWLGRSILRQAYKNWLIKDRLLRVQAQTIERNGMGIPLYKDAPDGTPDTMAKGLAMATAWRAGEAAGSAIPHEADLVLRGVEGDLPDALPAIRYHDEQIARAVLAHFLNLGTQTGSWALGTTFADFFTLSLQTLAQQIADTATQHVVEDLVDHNFGEDEPAPRLVFDEIGSRQAATAAAIKLLVDAGVIHPDQVLEESSRQQYGLPPADPATTTTPPGTPSATPPAPTQMGDMSTAVAAGGVPKEVAAGAVDPTEVDEEADDWEESIDALLVALDELSGHVEARAWDPAKHPRNPKHSPGGGRFRSMVDRLKDAIEDHLKGGGEGHPFDSFDREQLRRTARARGITLKRGESRDTIAKLLLDDLHRGSGVKTPPTPKKVAKPRARKPPAALTPAQELQRWRADAAKPGRVRNTTAGGPTKREEYVASWDQGIAATRKDIADAEAQGFTHRLDPLRKTLEYQIKARDTIATRQDPDLDEPASGITHTLARKVDRKRPLAVYGDMLHLDASDDGWTHLNLTELEKVPAELHGVVAARMAEKSTGGIWVGETGVSSMDHAHDLAGEQPRGWGDRHTFDDVNGAYRPAQRVVLVGRTANSEHRAATTASHELGHALDDALGTPSMYAEWKRIHAKALAEPHLSPYYRQSGRAGPEEFWAEAFSTWVRARQRQPGYETRATYIVRLDVPAELGDEIHDYFNRLAEQHGVG